MATLTIRHIEEDLKKRLRLEAAHHGHSMEEEVRIILRAALNKPLQQYGLGSRVHQRFAAIGGVDLTLPERTDKPRAVELEE